MLEELQEKTDKQLSIRIQHRNKTAAHRENIKEPNGNFGDEEYNDWIEEINTKLQ